MKANVLSADLKHAKSAKKGDNLDCGNFRPVCILTCISKVFEILMADIRDAV